MKFGIIGAMEVEIKHLLATMNVTDEKKIYDTTFYSGTIEGQEVVLVCCSVATVNAALFTSVLIREFGVGTVINVGVAGATDDRLSTLDVVISKNVAYHDMEPNLYENYPYRLSFEADEKLINLAEQAILSVENRDYNYLVGDIATGDVFVSGGAVRDSIIERLHPACVEMEGAAVAHTAYINGVPFLVLRAMSDTADDEATISFYDLVAKAAERASAILHAMLRMYQD